MSQFRAKNETAWAAVFDTLGEPWKYEALEPDLSRALRYMPDFWLTGRLVWVEIKSQRPTPGEVRLAMQLHRATGSRVYVLSGWPWRRSYEVSIFSRVGSFHTARYDWCDLALCALFDLHFSQLYAAFEAVRQRGLGR